jgi:hypothetical protein
MAKPSPPAGSGCDGAATAVTTACTALAPALAITTGLSTRVLPSKRSE